MLHKEFWGMLFLGFVAWVFLAGTPQGRIKNVCAPIGWTGNVVVSLSALVLPDQQTTIQGYFNRFEYGCQFLTWRLFYQEDYNKYLAQQRANGLNKVAPAKSESGPLPPATPEKASDDASKADTGKPAAEPAPAGDKSAAPAVAPPAAPAN